MRDFDTLVHLRFTSEFIPDREGNPAHGKNENIVALLTSYAVISSFAMRFNTDPAALINFLVNVAAHEVVHASRTITDYDHDSMGGRAGDPGSPSAQVSASERAKALGEFSVREAKQLRQMLNSQGDTEEWLAEKKKEMAEARHRRHSHG